MNVGFSDYPTVYSAIKGLLEGASQMADVMSSKAEQLCVGESSVVDKSTLNAKLSTKEKTECKQSLEKTQTLWKRYMKDVDSHEREYWTAFRRYRGAVEKKHQMISRRDDTSKVSISY